MSKPEGIPEMEYRFLGRSGLQVSAISIGGWLTFGGHIDREKTFECMKAAHDCGINFFDCAESYSNGESEKVMGDAIRQFGWKRCDYVISTKIYWGAGFSDGPIVNARGLSRKHIIEGLHMALERLGLSYVDLVYAHRPDRQTPMEEIVRAFNHVINQGKALYWGTSEWNADEIALAWRVADKLGLIGPLMEQPEYNMIDRTKVESEYANLYRETGLGLTVWSPLKQGLLTGKYKNGIPSDSRFAQEQIPFVVGFLKRTAAETFAKWVDTVNRLEPIAEKLSCKLSVLALAWVLANPNVSSAIMGASSAAQVYENAQALAVYKKLSPELMAEIDVILDNRPPALLSRF